MSHNKYGIRLDLTFGDLYATPIFSWGKMNEILSILLIENNRTLFPRLPNPLRFLVRCGLFASPPPPDRDRVADTASGVRVKL